VTNYIVLAIPVFFLLIGLELALARWWQRDLYRLPDSLADLGCGMLDQLLEVFTKSALFAGYAYVYTHLRLFDVPLDAPAAWLLCFVGVDFFYYWFHRASHEVNFLWAAHSVHHQSEEYNLTVALRQGALQGWFSWVFYLPLALCGFPPVMFLTLASVNTLYQFWIHTRVIGRLGALESWLNTPSNHRVHHGRNPRYIDRNHGGTLIVWDRLFGTYAAETEEPVYGITTPLRSWNPAWANLQYWVELLGKARRCSRWRDRLRLFFARPGWHPVELGGFVPAPPVEPSRYRKFTTRVPVALSVYASLHFVFALGLTTALLFRQQELTLAWRLAGASGVLCALISIALLLEGRAWAFGLEAARVALSMSALVGAWYLAGRPAPWSVPMMTLASAAVVLVCWAWLAACRRDFATASQTAWADSR
jgi:sterol desaturase/sphingolipid hydroxylase (fatty acid hydroxylase superfamily)